MRFCAEIEGRWYPWTARTAETVPANSLHLLYLSFTLQGFRLLSQPSQPSIGIISGYRTLTYVGCFPHWKYSDLSELDKAGVPIYALDMNAAQRQKGLKMKTQINIGDEVKINGKSFVVVQVTKVGERLMTCLSGNGWNGMAIVRRKNGSAMYNALIGFSGQQMIGSI